MTQEDAIRKIEYMIHTEVKWPGTEDTVEALEMALAALRKEKTDGWVSVADRLPEDYGPVLVCWTRNDSNMEMDGTTTANCKPKHTVTISCYLPGNLTMTGKDEFALAEVIGYSTTHWMPLPSPPEEA